MTLIADIIIAALVIGAGLFGLIGSWGMIKLPDPMTWLHAPTKAATLGLGGVLIASMLWFWVHQGRVSYHELLVTLFILATSPITAHFLSKANMHRDIAAKNIPAPPGSTWGTHALGSDSSAKTLTGDPAKGVGTGD